MTALSTSSNTSLKTKRKEIVWSDDEAELLLNIVNDYKVAKATDSIDWESVKSKYKDIHELFISALPTERTADNTHTFPHNKEELTQSVIASKLKSIRIKFRKAVDSGRRSGHGRVVMIYYELCENIWGGSPATEQLDNGIESVELVTNDDTGGSESAEIFETSTSVDIEHTDDTSDTTDDHIRKDIDSQKQRREFIDNKLKNYKDRLKRKLPVDTQLLNCTQEELQIKKRMLDHMDKIDQRYSQNMERMTQSMEKLSQSIADGFSLMKQFMMYQQPPSMYHRHAQSIYNSFIPTSPLGDPHVVTSNNLSPSAQSFGSSFDC